MKRTVAIALLAVTSFVSTKGGIALGATHLRLIQHGVDYLSRNSGTSDLSLWFVVFRTLIDTDGTLEEYGPEAPSNRSAKTRADQ
jgi:hypothetical protein